MCQNNKTNFIKNFTYYLKKIEWVESVRRTNYWKINVARAMKNFTQQFKENYAGLARSWLKIKIWRLKKYD